MLARTDGLVFVGERIDTPGAWQMPQGGIDKGETIREAGLRELEEETGVSRDLVKLEAETRNWITYDLPPDLIGKIWKGRYRGQKQMWVLLRFLGSDGDINILSDHPEFARWDWSSPDDVLRRIVPFKRGVYEAVLSEFGPYL